MEKIIVLPQSNALSPELTKQTLKVLKTVWTPTGDLEVDKARAKKYADMVGMDTANAKMMEVACTQGMDASAKAMVSECTNDEGKFDYCAMRARYG